MELLIYLTIVGVVAYMIWGTEIDRKFLAFNQRRSYLRSMEEQYQYLIRAGKASKYVGTIYFTHRKEMSLCNDVAVMETIWDGWQKAIDGLQE